MHKDRLKTAPINKAYKAGYKGIDWDVGRKEREAERSRQAMAKATIVAKRGQGLQIVPDIPSFIDPIEGKVIGGRSQRREFMKRHDVHDVGDDRPPPRKETPRAPVADDIKRAIAELESR